MKVRPRVLARRLKLAKELAQENGGVLPNPWRMIQEGHGSLYRYIYRHPEEFDKFEYQDVVGGTNKTTFNIGIREKHLRTARNLLRIHDKLPAIKWLNDNGFTPLASYMRIHPDVFNGLSTSKKKRYNATCNPC